MVCDPKCLLKDLNMFKQSLAVTFVKPWITKKGQIKVFCRLMLKSDQADGMRFQASLGFVFGLGLACQGQRP